ncbi:MAG: type pilus assembly protein PilM [Verrucomicrobiota bacterium]|jgi:type IV pilus assembly protein PilM
MADTPNSIALNIGSQRISVAVFETSKSGGLVLKSYDSESIVADPALEASRIPQSRVAIADLAQRLKLGKSKVRYAISGQAVFTRFVKLPPIQADNVEQLVTFEAQQHVPFPLDEVVWDYELIDGAAEKEAVIVAIKSDALDEINGMVNEGDLATAEVDVAPMALYNAFLAAYGQPEEPVLLVDIGAKTSNLLYIEGNRFFTRSVAVGGAAVTAAIAKEYHIPFLDAEHQKISNGVVGLGAGYAQDLDDGVAALAGVIRNALGRLISEITRTTSYYRSQQGGSAPRRVMLAGGGANLPYTLEFFQEKLNLPVEYFNPLQAVTLAKGIDAESVQREAHTMGELVGLALRGVGKSQLHIDLVPQSVEQARAADRRKPFLIAAAAILIAGMGAWAVMKNMAASKAAEEARSMMEQRDALAPLKSQIDGLLKKETALRRIADAYTNLESDHVHWIDVISEVREAFASDAVWLTDFEPISGYDPMANQGPKAASGARGAVANGKEVVKQEFFNTPYGASSVNDVKSATEATPQAKRPARGAAAAAPAAAATANAVRIKGYWLANPKSQNLVSDLLKNLREKSTSFRFTVKDAKGVETTLSDEQILAITVEGEPGDLGMPFQVTLPLAREIAIK